MIMEIPQYCVRAYALFWTKYRSREPFQQQELDWVVSQSMKKKIFAILLKSGWIKKKSRTEYACVPPEMVMKGLLDFKVPEIIKQAQWEYAFTGLSAIEIWSDFSYIQRSREKSPYFIEVLKKDINYWKQFFNEYNIPYYINKGSTIGEYVILIPVARISNIMKNDIKVKNIKETIKMAGSNEIYEYAYQYIKKNYGSPAA